MKILFNKRIVLVFLIVIFIMSFVGVFTVNAEEEFSIPTSLDQMTSEEQDKLLDRTKQQLDINKQERTNEAIQKNKELNPLERQSEESIKKAVEVSSKKESGTAVNQKESSGKQTGEFVALEGDFFEQKLGGQEAVKNPSIFFNNLFQFGVYIAGFLATIMIAIGGITYMTTGATDGKKLGKEMITSALTGLLIILFSWILLNQINPDLLNLNLSNNSSSGNKNIKNSNNTDSSGDIYYKDASIYVGEDETGFYKVIGEDKNGKEIRIYPYLDSQTEPDFKSNKNDSSSLLLPTKTNDKIKALEDLITNGNLTETEKNLAREKIKKLRNQ